MSIKGSFSIPEIPEKYPTPEISYPIPENFRSSKTRHTRTRLFQLREFPYPPEFDFFRTRHITSLDPAQSRRKVAKNLLFSAKMACFLAIFDEIS